MPISKNIRDRPIEARDFLQALNREIAPVLSACRAALNRWLRFPPALTVSSGVIEADWNSSRSFSVSLSSNVTNVVFDDPADAGSYELLITQSGGGHTMAGWPSNVIWLDGGPPVVPSTDGAPCIVSLFFDGENYYGAISPEADPVVPVSVPTSITLTLVNDELVTVVMCTPVYVDAAGGFKKARANTAAIPVGLVSAASIASGVSGPVIASGLLTATTAQWDTVTGQFGGLTFGKIYYLDPNTAGMITATPPTILGQYVVQIGVALSSTSMKVDIESSILL